MGIIIGIIVGIITIIGVIVSVFCSIGKTPDHLQGYYGKSYWTIALVAIFGFGIAMLVLLLL